LVVYVITWNKFPPYIQLLPYARMFKNLPRAFDINGPN